MKVRIRWPFSKGGKTPSEIDDHARVAAQIVATAAYERFCKLFETGEAPNDLYYEVDLRFPRIGKSKK